MARRGAGVRFVCVWGGGVQHVWLHASWASRVVWECCTRPPCLTNGFGAAQGRQPGRTRLCERWVVWECRGAHGSAMHVLDTNNHPPRICSKGYCCILCRHPMNDDLLCTALW
eukprot:187074-Chlamydomonas_euryale.AAC.5